jgi:undecaprenyl diphosphate synthase
MNFNRRILLDHRDDLHAKGVRIRFAGRRDWRVPRGVLKVMDETAALTAANRRMTFTIAFNYGGRAEILDAVAALMRDGVSAEKVSEKTLRKYLYAPDMPDPDLVIRTSGEFRISNFLLWELAYSELIFSPLYWPDFRREDLWAAIREYQARDRRFGGIGEAPG